MAAAAPFHLGTTGADGITLTRITIGASEAEYELRGTEGPPAILHASPHLSLTRIDGSDVTLETSESALSPPVRAAMATLRDSLHKNLTTEAWNEMLTVGTMPGGGSSTPGFSKWWFLFGVEVVALVGWAIWRRRKGARPPAQG